MVAGEMERVTVVLQKQGFEVGKRVVLSEQSPDVLTRIGSGVAELDGLQAGELIDERSVDDELLTFPLEGESKVTMSQCESFRQNYEERYVHLDAKEAQEDVRQAIG